MSKVSIKGKEFVTDSYHFPASISSLICEQDRRYRNLDVSNPGIKTLVEAGHVHPDGSIIQHKGEEKPEWATDSRQVLHHDWDRHNELCREIWGNEGQYWDDRRPEDIEQFLQKFFKGGEELKLLEIRRYVRMSDGYPCWWFGLNKPFPISSASSSRLISQEYNAPDANNPVGTMIGMMHAMKDSKDG